MKNFIFYRIKIYRKFIKEISNNKLTSLTNIRKIAIEINNNVVKCDKNR